jgi:tryptophan synthase alpha chain
MSTAATSSSTSPSALTRALATAREQGRAALIGYLPVGYPTIDASVAGMRAMVDGGVDVIEVGLPYSDPVMDGPVIQQAADVAVRAGVGVGDAVRAAGEVAAAGAVAVVMSYWNPIEHYGVQRFATELAAAGGAGAITPDLIPDEAGEWLAATDESGLDRIFLIAPSSTDARIAATTASCRGFVYAASAMGVTGVRSVVGNAAQSLVARSRVAAPLLPVCVGLGVSNADQAAEVAAYADGVIVGSAFVRLLLDSPDQAGIDAVGRLAAELASGVRR